ncbi:YfbK domain-containing protein, partial [Acinetobacter baumannii]
LAQFGMLLRNSEYKGRGGYELAIDLISGIKGDDREGYRKELLQLMKTAFDFSKKREQQPEISYQR